MIFFSFLPQSHFLPFCLPRLLGAFAKLRQVTFILVLSFRPHVTTRLVLSVRPHGTTRLVLSARPHGTTRLVLSVRSHATTRLVLSVRPHGTTLLVRKSVNKIQVAFKSGKNKEYFNEDQCIHI